LLKRLLPGLGLTLLAAVIGYMGLALTPFPGLRQMAVFSALGLVFAWLTVVFWFPALIGSRTLRSGGLVRVYGAALLRWPLLRLNRATLAAAVVFVLAAGYGISRLGANDDIRLLQNPPKHLIADQIKLSKLLDAPTPVQYFLVRGDSAETVLQREEALKARLDTLIAAKRISGYQAMSNWVPSAKTQAARRALIEEKLLADGGPLQGIATQTGEDAQWIAATRKGLLAAAAPLTLDDFLKAPASDPWRHLWLGRTEGVHASIVALRGLSSAAVPQVLLAAEGLDGVQWVDKVAEISSVLGRYRVYMSWVVLGAYAVVFALLFARYRGRTWRVLAPTALASIATLALLGFASQNLQLFHVLALMLLLGVGVDYGIFMQEHPDRRDHTPWLAVGMSAANTILSFGLLGLSSTPALQAFGLTMLLGTALVWLIVPCFGSIKESKHD
jgi:predicted exporter